jgi:hypothetical protein
MKGSSSPSRLEITCRGRTCLGKPVGSPTSARERFGRRSLVVVPSAGEPRPNAEKELCAGETREVVSSRFPLPLHQRTLVWGRSPPPTFSLPVRWHTDLSLSPSPRPCFLTRDVFRLPPHGILWRSGLLWLIIAAPRSCAKLRAPLKDRIMKAAKTGPSLLTLALTIPFRKGTWPTPGFGMTPRSRTLWIQASTYAALNSLEEGQSGQLSLGYIPILILCLRSGWIRWLKMSTEGAPRSAPPIVVAERPRASAVAWRGHS